MAVLLTVPLMVMVSDNSEVFEKVLLLSTGLPDLKDKWLAIVVFFMFAEISINNKDSLKWYDFKILEC